MIGKYIREFMDPGMGGYSEQQMMDDYRDIIKKNYSEEEFTTEEVLDFYKNVVYIMFEKGKINNWDDLYNVVMNDSALLD